MLTNTHAILFERQLLLNAFTCHSFTNYDGHERDLTGIVLSLGKITITSNTNDNNNNNNI